MITLLPDHVANQIAAGEVVQRPASAVKELMENAIDAKATDIKLIIKDSGKTLIRVIDNGSGMNEVDARMCFERHATSKISTADDLFTLKTKGFRGEALASIAAIAQVELKTKKEDAELGIQLTIEGSEFKSQEACTCPNGTSFSIKNIFFNVPARRNFLKSDRAEYKYILDEFIRIALAHPGVAFSLINNEKEQYQLPKETPRQRLVSLFGKKYNTRLVPVEEKTDIVNVSGFICKPEFAKKSRGEQFFFVNDRFIKSPYMNHAVSNAMEGLLQGDHHPSYFLFLEIDPAKIDVNIHPTKTEIKFEDERSIYAILRSALKRSLGQYNIAPSLDFSLNPDYQVPVTSKGKTIKTPTIEVDPDFNPFEQEKEIGKTALSGGFSSSKSFSSPTKSAKGKHWEALFEEIQEDMNAAIPEYESQPLTLEAEFEIGENRFAFQLQKRFILTQLKSGILIIDQQRAHERVLYEQYFKSLQNNRPLSQQLLFPQEIHLSPGDMELFKEIMEDVEALGFDFTIPADHCLMINGVPFETKAGEVDKIIDSMLDSYKNESDVWKADSQKYMAGSLAQSNAVKTGKTMVIEEINQLIDELFACELPFISIHNKPTAIILEINELIKRFQ
ncbi:MAG: DNA mismatch repair endonuclease MutL [Flavobacteriales bacterium]|nr:DNA mismatch repair endonuclease MutL [Flavobacteriales bacterium]